MCRNVDTHTSSHASLTGNVTDSGDEDDAKQSKVVKGEDWSSSVLSKYVNAGLTICLHQLQLNIWHCWTV